MTRILIVEDTDNLRRGLRDLLEAEGFEVVEAADGPAALRITETSTVGLIVLDLMLPGMSGQRVLRSLRERQVATPVVVLTAKNDEEEKVRLFQLGADDYVTKPFSRRELTARIEAVLRRSRGAEPTTPVRTGFAFGTVVVDVRSRTVVKDGQPVPLTPKEFDLLAALGRRAGAVVSRTELLTEVWGYQADVASRTVDLHILELRRKLEPDPALPRYLLTARKAGYRLAPTAGPFPRPRE